jgi:hypothetical protein
VSDTANPSPPPSAPPPVQPKPLNGCLKAFLISLAILLGIGLLAFGLCVHYLNQHPLNIR